MNFSLQHRGAPGLPEKAFTLPELMVTIAIFTLAMAAMLTAFLFGGKMYRIAEAKLRTTDQARTVVTKFSDEVRSAARIRVGTGGLSSFTEATNGAAQQGNALQIYLTNGSSGFIRYYRDTNDNRLKRTTDSTTAITVLANAVTNQIVFTSEDYAGGVLTNNQNNRVVGLNLDFELTELGRTFDYYRFHTKVTRRALE